MPRILLVEDNEMNRDMLSRASSVRDTRSTSPSTVVKECTAPWKAVMPWS